MVAGSGERALADVFLPYDGSNVNHTLVKDASAGGIESMRRGIPRWERLETEAKGERRGLWVEPNPIPPWEWRLLGKSR